jgi:hypothetical protein
LAALGKPAICNVFIGGGGNGCRSLPGGGAPGAIVSPCENPSPARNIASRA